MNQNNIFLKYKNELTKVKKIINDDYIYQMWYHYGFTLNNKFIELDSNINIYEALFISQCLQYYIQKYHTPNTKFNLLEIGLAYGTSSIIMMNQLLKLKGKVDYTIIDANQTQQWKSIGIKHIQQYIQYKNINNKKNINIELIEDYSQNAMHKLRKKYNFIFIDGSHDKKIVIQDLENSHKKLKKYGLVLLDDVRHEGVKHAIQIFYNKHKHQYKKIIIKNNQLEQENVLKFSISNKKNINNPNTMYAYQKIE